LLLHQEQETRPAACRCPIRMVEDSKNAANDSAEQDEEPEA
jgi:hypothetical protein